MLRQKSCIGAFSMGGGTAVGSSAAASTSGIIPTTDEKPPIQAKPNLPIKPAHIRPGLKPVKIPTVDDKLVVSGRQISLIFVRVILSILSRLEGN